LANYLALVNKVAARLGWDAKTTADFTDPGRPWDAFKDFLNEGKDEILDELGIRDSEEEFAFNTIVPYTTGNVVGTEAATTVNGTGTTWTAAMVGRKMSCSAFDGWMRLATFNSTISMEFDANIRTTFASGDDTYSIFQDEYDLDADVREVLSAWVDEGPLDLNFVSEAYWFDRHYPGSTDEGTPREMAVFRSGTTGMIWRCQLRPAPDDDYVVRYKARVRLGNLSASTDSWEIQPEIETLIVDRAVYKAAISKVANDPELALVVDADLQGRMNAMRDRQKDPLPMRRRRRLAADEIPGRERAVLDPTRFHY
jgi:hypothetical protein